MNKIKFITLAAVVMILASFNSAANADGVGFINYRKVQENYGFAMTSVKEVDAKALELQQFLVDKEKEFKAIDTPVKKKNFEEKTTKEFKVKEAEYIKLKAQKEEAVYAKIQEAAKDVLVEQKLDAIVDFRIIFVGGIDVTDLVIQKLKIGK